MEQVGSLKHLFLNGVLLQEDFQSPVMTSSEAREHKVTK